MKQIYIYGAGGTGQKVFNIVKNTHDVKGFLDSDQAKWGTTFNSIPIVGGADVTPELDYEEIIIASLTGMKVIRDQLLKWGVPYERINVEYVVVQVEARLNFLRDFASINIGDVGELAVAEGGVFQGDFAKVINECFPDSTIYLFDTFDGFDAQDVDVDKTRGYSDTHAGRFNDTSVDLVMSKLPHPEKAIIRKGFFPETAKGLEDQKFFFVNLDFDLYQPILEGLRFFYPRLSGRGEFC